MITELNSEYKGLVTNLPMLDAYKILISEKAFSLLAGHTFSKTPELLRKRKSVNKCLFKNSDYT